MARVDSVGLQELRSAGFTVAIGPDRLSVEAPGTVALWRPTFSVEPASKLSPSQRKAVRASHRRIRLELEMEALGARIWDPASGPDPDTMFDRWTTGQPAPEAKTGELL
jgi:hypothetical protein